MPAGRLGARAAIPGLAGGWEPATLERLDPSCGGCCMPVQRPASYSTLLALLVLGIASACGDDPGGPRTPAVVEPLTPSPISATAGTSVSLAVRVLDNRGYPMPGVAV